MPSQEERLIIVEQTLLTLRMDFLQVISDNTRSMTALSRAVTQQEQNLRDADHEITILLGVVGKQGQDIKSIKEDMSVVKSDLSSVKASVEAHDKRFDSVDQRFDSVDQRFDSVDQRLDGLDKKFDQVLLMLSKLTPGQEKS